MVAATEARDKTGVKVDGEFYEFPSSYNLTDSVLVEQVTNLAWDDFAERLDKNPGDPVCVIGLVAVAIWHQNPNWSRRRVAEYVDRISLDTFEVIVGEDPTETPQLTLATGGDSLGQSTLDPEGTSLEEPSLDETTPHVSGALS